MDRGHYEVVIAELKPLWEQDLDVYQRLGQVDKAVDTARQLHERHKKNLMC